MGLRWFFLGLAKFELLVLFVFLSDLPLADFLNVDGIQNGSMIILNGIFGLMVTVRWCKIQME